MSHFLEFDIGQDYDSSLRSMEVLRDPLHNTKSFDEFRKHFRSVRTIRNVPLFEIFHFLEIGAEGGIVQPQVNYHGIESDIEHGIRKQLKEGLREDKDTGWTFELVLVTMKNIDVGQPIGDDELRVHNMKNRTLVPNKTCQFATYDEFPWEIIKSEAQMYLSTDSENYDHKKPTIQNQIQTGDYLPYKISAGGKRYCWAVIDGLQRLSAIVNILNEDYSNSIGELKVDVRLNCPLISNCSVSQSKLRNICCAHSKEIAMNNKVISTPTLCSELSSVVMLAAEKLLPCNLNFTEQSIEILEKLVQQTKQRKFLEEKMYTQLKTVVEDLKAEKSDDGNSLLKWKNVLRKIDVKKRVFRMIYVKPGGKKQDWMEENLPAYYCIFLYCLFICYYQDSKFLVKFQGIKKVFNERSLGKQRQQCVTCFYLFWLDYIII